MATLPLHGEQAGPKKLGQVAAHRLRRDPRAVGELLRGPGPSIHQGREHSRPGGIPHEGSHGRDVDVCIHSSMVVDVFMVYNRPGPGHGGSRHGQALFRRPRARGYRWIVVGVSTAVSGLAWGARSTFALFYVAMLTELAWGRGPTALGYSLSWLAFVAFAPVAGWLHDRWGARTVVTIGGLVLGLALALTGQVASLTQYYVCFGVLSAAGIAGVDRARDDHRDALVRTVSRHGDGSLEHGRTGECRALLPRERLADPHPRMADRAPGLRLHRRGGHDVARSTLPGSADSPGTCGREPGARTASRRLPAARSGHSRRALRSVRLWAAFIMTALGVIGFQIMATHQVAHAVDRGFHADHGGLGLHGWRSRA